MKELHNTEEFIKEYNKQISSQEQETLLYITDTVLAAYGEESSLDLNYVKNHKISTIKLLAPCGTCVCLEDDISILSIGPIFKEFCKVFISDLQCFLQNKGINSEIHNNDLLAIKGKSKYKVASFCIGASGNNIIEATHVSYSMDEDIINSICTKGQLKKPKGLKDFNIDYTELLNFIKAFIQQHNL